MTEQEWLACKRPVQMIEYLLKKNASDRKLRLFGCSLFYGREQYAHFADIVEIAERMADGLAYPEEIESAYYRYDQEVRWILSTEIANMFPSFLSVSYFGYTVHKYEDIHRVHENFGNPFHPVWFHYEWRTEKVLALANTIYDKRAYELMPILADELEEAGCESAEVLSHCRDGGPHGRGCWAVDVVLEKE